MIYVVYLSIFKWEAKLLVACDLHQQNKCPFLINPFKWKKKTTADLKLQSLWNLYITYKTRSCEEYYTFSLFITYFPKLRINHALRRSAWLNLNFGKYVINYEDHINNDLWNQLYTNTVDSILVAPNWSISLIIFFSDAWVAAYRWVHIYEIAIMFNSFFINEWFHTYQILQNWTQMLAVDYMTCNFITTALHVCYHLKNKYSLLTSSRNSTTIYICKRQSYKITKHSTACSKSNQSEHKKNIEDTHYWPFVMGIHRWPEEALHKVPVMRKTCPCCNAIMAESDVNDVHLKIMHTFIPALKSTSVFYFCPLLNISSKLDCLASSQPMMDIIQQDSKRWLTQFSWSSVGEANGCHSDQGFWHSC